ncbi:MAG TPA: hypothetical protein DCS93_06140 [Microscillaceae bacterium]|nr:hypothetical protein [Microscillaceae bacterium]
MSYLSEGKLADFIEEKIKELIGKGNILIVVPPFYDIRSLALGPYVLQAVAKQKGYKVDVLHLDLLLAAIIGVKDYQQVHDSPDFWMLGERVFARIAYDLPALGKASESAEDPFWAISDTPNAVLSVAPEESIPQEKLLKIEEVCYQLMRHAARVIGQFQYEVIGVSLGFCNQINATVAFINQVKQHLPQCTTIIGGSYCEGEKAKGLFSLSKHIDYVFEGESEGTFVQFLSDVFEKTPPTEKLIKATEAVALEKMPLADYTAYEKQVRVMLGDTFYEKNIFAVWYETNRGCWWAEKAKCSFCGIAEIGFRQKSIEQIRTDLKEIRRQVPGKLVFFTDLIMSQEFPKKMLEYRDDMDEIPVMGMQMRVARNIEEVANLREIKAKFILPGVESFSTKLLKKLKKGTTGKQNIYFLRNTRSFGIFTQYFLLWGLPDDEHQDYQQLLDLIPLIIHLQPPRTFVGMRIGRDSPYFDQPAKHNIENLRYWEVYKDIFPSYTDWESIANYYIGDYKNYAHYNLPLIQELDRAVTHWKNTWQNAKLHMEVLGGQCVIYDFRQVPGIGTAIHPITYAQAQEIMLYKIYKPSPTLDWALKNKLGILMDGWFVPLVTAAPELLVKFDQEAKSNTSQNSISHYQSYKIT